MFTRDGIIDLLPVYPYQLEYLAQELDGKKTVTRAFISKNNDHYEKFSMAGCRYVANYLASQHHPLLKGFVPRKYDIYEQTQPADPSSFFNTTYFDRVCHTVMVPMRGEVTYRYPAIEGVEFKLKVGRAYAVNNRLPREIVSVDPGFRCFVSQWIDFDLAYYLKEYDGNSKCERKSDEFI